MLRRKLGRAAGAKEFEMIKHVVIGTLFVCCALSAPALAADDSDPCMSVALAKYHQWNQRRIEISETKTFADGSKKSSQLFVTSNTAYVSRSRTHWHSVAASRGDRAAPSPDVILANMKLADCTESDGVQEGGQAATLYTYSYQPDANGYVSTGKLWVATASGLPLREDMTDPAPPANRLVATAISSTYLYNGDVVIPRGAELAESNRLFYNQGSVAGAQAPIGAVGNGAQ